MSSPAPFTLITTAATQRASLPSSFDDYLVLNSLPPTSTSATKTMAPSLRTYPSAASASLHVYNGHNDIHIGDTATNTSSNPPTTAGFFTLQKGCKATTTFGFDEWKFVSEGTFVLTDGESGKRVRLEVGDVFFIPNGSTITFETEEEGGKAFFVAQRPLNEARKAGVRPSKL